MAKIPLKALNDQNFFLVILKFSVILGRFKSFNVVYSLGWLEGVLVILEILGFCSFQRMQGHFGVFLVVLKFKGYFGYFNGNFRGFEVFFFFLSFLSFQGIFLHYRVSRHFCSIQRFYGLLWSFYKILGYFGYF